MHRRPRVLSRRTQLVDDTDTDAARQAYRIEATLLAWLRDVRQLVGLGHLRLRLTLAYPSAVRDAEAALWIRGQLGFALAIVETLMSA